VGTKACTAAVILQHSKTAGKQIVPLHRLKMTITEIIRSYQAALQRCHPMPSDRFNMLKMRGGHFLVLCCPFCCFTNCIYCQLLTTPAGHDAIYLLIQLQERAEAGEVVVPGVCLHLQCSSNPFHQSCASGSASALSAEVRRLCRGRARPGRMLLRQGHSAEVLCEHGRQRSVCKSCGGASICEHGRRYCKSCGGCAAEADAAP
jgi:hypothetical protein